MRTARGLAIGSLIVGVVVLALKLGAYYLTGSVALLSDALESTVNLATAIAALIAVQVAAAPADDRHPYGHHKSEYFSAGAEGVMIAIAAAMILREAYYGFLSPRTLEAPFAGLALNGLASAITAETAQRKRWSRLSRDGAATGPSRLERRHRSTGQSSL